MSQVPATQQDMQFASTGLDDMSMSDAVIPRIRIKHAEGTWEDNMGGVPMSSLRFIVLGLVKQRVLFHPNVEDGDMPMCKSTDFETGFPNMDQLPRDKQYKAFPWQASGFNPSDFPPDTEGNVALPCGGCQLKEWGSHPTSSTPYCSEQWTMPIYYDQGVGTSEELWTPAILTLQKSSIKPIRQYLTSFKSGNKPPFMAIANGTLKVQTRGEVTYSTPTFIKEGESDRSRWNEFYEQYIEMRDYLTRPPVREDDGEGAPSQPVDNTNRPPTSQAPTQQPAAEQPPVQQPPAQEPSAQQAPPQQDPWAAPAAQTPPPAPSAPPVQEAAPPQQPPAAPPAPGGGQGLPF